jgi:hypothetical protein
MDAAFHNLYDFDFPAANSALDRYIAAHPDAPFGYAIRGSACLFFELDRLGILESEFFASDRRIAEKKRLKPDPATRMRFYKAVDEAQNRAGAVLAQKPEDREALFSMAVALGLITDYTALIEKRQISSLSSARSSNRYAQRLIKLDPTFYDAYLTTGITEYMVGSLPFFIRWFVRFDDVRGSKDQGIRNLKMVAQSGRYFKPFAKILLGIAYLREKQPLETRRLLRELSLEYPRNPLIRKELDKVSAALAGGGQ